jgi:hypothetical protein
MCEMLSLLVLLHVEYFLRLLHCFLFQLLELLHLLWCLLLTESSLKLVLELRLNNGGCGVAQGHGHHLVIGGLYLLLLLLGFGFSILCRLLLEVFER